MVSSFAQGIVTQLSDVLPSDVMDQLRPSLVMGLTALEQHGDQAATANVQKQVHALCKAIRDGDHEAAAELIGEWGVLATAFGVDPSSLVGVERGEKGPGHAVLADRVSSVVGKD